VRPVAVTPPAPAGSDSLWIAQPTTVRDVEWLGEAHIQIGAHDAPPPAQVAPFVAGFVHGLAAHPAVRAAQVVEADTPGVEWTNPTRHVSFRFLAGSREAAERFASDELRRAATHTAVQALDPSLRQVGWMMSIDVRSA
jgi:hypothetical protein